MVNWPWRRKFLSVNANRYVRFAMGLKVHDATAGFRAYRATTLAGLDLAGVESQGYCFQVDMTWRVIQAGGRVVEVPITFVERELGVSKMSGDIIKEALVKVTVWGAQRRCRQTYWCGASGPKGRAELASAVGAEQHEALLQKLFELGDGATLEQHVPVRASLTLFLQSLGGRRRGEARARRSGTPTKEGRRPLRRTAW